LSGEICGLFPTDAETSLQKFLATTSDPAAKAKALLASGEAKIGVHKPDASG
jgi:hypothetical protein